MVNTKKRPSLLRRLFRSAVLGLTIFAGGSIGAPSLSNAFNQAAVDYRDPEALRQSQHIPVRDGTVIGFDFSNATSMRSIAETGKVPSYPLVSLGNLHIGNPRIDWQKDDAFTRTMADLKERVLQEVGESRHLQRLLEKDEWTRADRETWESRISGIVSLALSRTDGLDKYRTDGVTPTRRLNDLSSDIENRTALLEFDCEAMSIVEGVLLQQIEDHFLFPADNAADYKGAFNYYYVKGGVSFDSYDTEIGGHAYIISSATGNIIEGTAEWGSYNYSAIPGYSFQDFVNGKPAVTRDGSVYGGNLTIEEARAWRDKVLGPERSQMPFFFIPVPPALTQ